jgi:hypothetical protein
LRRLKRLQGCSIRTWAVYWVIFFTYSESYKSVCYLCFLPMVWKLKLHFQPLPFVHSC